MGNLKPPGKCKELVNCLSANHNCGRWQILQTNFAISFPILTFTKSIIKIFERVLLSTNNIYFGWEIRKLFFCYTLLTKVLKVLSTEVDETEFSIAIYCLTGDKWQSKKTFLAMFDPRSFNVKSIFDCRLSGVVLIRIVLQWSQSCVNQSTKGQELTLVSTRKSSSHCYSFSLCYFMHLC